MLEPVYDPKNNGSPSITVYPVERRKNAGYETLVRYWVSVGATEAEARAAARKVHPTLEES